MMHRTVAILVLSLLCTLLVTHTVSARNCSEGCLPGSYCSLHTCVLCDPGMYSDTVNATACEWCGPGSATGTAEYGAVSCAECPANTYSIYAGNAFCSDCAASTFSRPHSTSCYYCPPSLVWDPEIGNCTDCDNSAGEFYPVDRSHGCLFCNDLLTVDSQPATHCNRIKGGYLAFIIVATVLAVAFCARKLFLRLCRRGSRRNDADSITITEVDGAAEHKKRRHSVSVTTLHGDQSTVHAAGSSITIPGTAAAASKPAGSSSRALSFSFSDSHLDETRQSLLPS